MEILDKMPTVFNWMIAVARPKAGTTFWDRVYSHVQQYNECTLFEGHRNQDGYGRINRDGRLVFVHREVWKRDHGEIPSGMEICHTCDTPNCITPKHLFAGTHSQNIKDMDRKGRRKTLIGIERNTAKLNDEKVRRIRVRLYEGDTCAEIARDNGVSEGLIRHIKKRRIWTHVQ